MADSVDILYYIVHLLSGIDCLRRLARERQGIVIAMYGAAITVVGMEKKCGYRKVIKGGESLVRQN